MTTNVQYKFRNWQIALCLALIAACSGSEPKDSGEATIIDPKSLSFNEYVYQELPADLLERIRATTDVFEPIDGISYEQAVDMYRRDINPGHNVEMWVSMAQAYSAFCEARCGSMQEKNEVYKTLLLASMFSKDDVMNQLQSTILSEEDVDQLISLYGRPPEPILVIKK
jgi:hypothetical protein